MNSLINLPIAINSSLNVGKDSGKLKNKMWGKDEDLNLIFTVDLVRERERIISFHGRLSDKCT